MWTAKDWFGFSRLQINENDQELLLTKRLVENEELIEAADAKSAHAQALKFSKKPEFKDHTFHVIKMGEKHLISIWPSEKHTVASYKGGEKLDESSIVQKRY